MFRLSQTGLRPYEISLLAISIERFQLRLCASWIIRGVDGVTSDRHLTSFGPCPHSTENPLSRTRPAFHALKVVFEKRIAGREWQDCGMSFSIAASLLLRKQSVTRLVPATKQVRKITGMSCYATPATACHFSTFSAHS